MVKKGDYITPEGFKKLRAELDHLWHVERPRVTHEVSEAAALGDRSENAEYIYGKKRLREIDRRLRFLGKRIDDLTVVKPDPQQEGKVFFGAWVTVEDEEGSFATYQLVGRDEVDPKQRKISLDSPMGKALIGKQPGDEVTVRRPKGAATFEIVGIRYDLE